MPWQRTPEIEKAEEALEAAMQNLVVAYRDSGDESNQDADSRLITGWLVTVKARSFGEQGSRFHYTHLKRHEMGMDEVLGLTAMQQGYWDYDMMHIISGCDCDEDDDD